MQAGENEGCEDQEAKINTALPGAPAAITPRLRAGSQNAGSGAQPAPVHN